MSIKIFKWIKDLCVKPETIKLLEENNGGTLFDIRLSNNFWHVSSQAKVTKAKTEKWDYMKLKSFLHREGNYQQKEKATY